MVDLGGSVGTMMENVANKFPDIGKCFSLDTEDIIRMAPKPKNKNVRRYSFRCNPCVVFVALFAEAQNLTHGNHLRVQERQRG